MSTRVCCPHLWIWWLDPVSERLGAAFDLIAELPTSLFSELDFILRPLCILYVFGTLPHEILHIKNLTIHSVDCVTWHNSRLLYVVFMPISSLLTTFLWHFVPFRFKLGGWTLFGASGTTGGHIRRCWIWKEKCREKLKLRNTFACGQVLQAAIASGKESNRELASLLPILIFALFASLLDAALPGMIVLLLSPILSLVSV